MIFILTEQAMNGTVTMAISNFGIEAYTFENAIEQIKKFTLFPYFEHITETDKEYSFILPETKNSLPVIGIMKNSPLEMI